MIVIKRNTPDPDESRAGYRSGEGAESALHHLLMAAHRRQKQKSTFPDSHPPTQPLDDGDDDEVDVELPP